MEIFSHIMGIYSSFINSSKVNCSKMNYITVYAGCQECLLGNGLLGDWFAEGIGLLRDWRKLRRGASERGGGGRQAAGIRLPTISGSRSARAG